MQYDISQMTQPSEKRCAGSGRQRRHKRNYHDHHLGIRLLAGTELPEIKAAEDTTIQVVLNKATTDFLGLSPEEAVKLGWAHGALLTTFPGDTTMATVDQVRAFAKGGSARIQR